MKPILPDPLYSLCLMLGRATNFSFSDIHLSSDKHCICSDVGAFVLFCFPGNYLSGYKFSSRVVAASMVEKHVQGNAYK